MATRVLPMTGHMTGHMSREAAAIIERKFQTLRRS